MTLLEKLFELFPVYPPGKLLCPQNQIYHLTDAHPGTIKMLVEMGREKKCKTKRLIDGFEDVREDGLYNGNKDHLLNLFKTLVISYMTKMVQIYYAF